MNTVRFGLSIARAIVTIPSDGFVEAKDSRPNRGPIPRQLVMAPYDHVDWNTVRKIAFECESLGYDELIVPDHLMMACERLEAWTTLSALGALTSRIRLGEHVLCIFFRGNPAVFAKQVATLDVITGGRVSVGLGVGYEMMEFNAYGIPLPKPNKRVQMLREYIEVLKRMWTHKRATYEGKFYTVKDAVCAPRPVQSHVPITIGGRGPRILRVAAEHADWVTLFGVTVQQCRETMKILQEECNRVGRDPNDVGISWGEWVVLLPTRQEVEKSTEKLKTSPATWNGTPDEYVERIRRYADIGVRMISPEFVDLPDMTSTRLFAKNVVPSFRTK